MSKLGAFATELSMIKSDDVRTFTEEVLRKAPNYFWVVPASSTGKHHPPQDNGHGGLVRHSRAVVYFGTRFCMSYNIEGRRRDLILASCILHDIVKYGFTMGRWTTKTHGKDGADFIMNVWRQNEELLPKGDVLTIGKCVALHMGRWTEGGKTFPTDWEVDEQIVHLSDMMSAGKEVMLGFLQESLIG